jgi:hypothetical protein
VRAKAPRGLKARVTGPGERVLRSGAERVERRGCGLMQRRERRGWLAALGRSRGWGHAERAKAGLRARGEAGFALAAELKARREGWAACGRKSWAAELGLGLLGRSGGLGFGKREGR